MRRIPLRMRCTDFSCSRGPIRSLSSGVSPTGTVHSPSPGGDFNEAWESRTADPVCCVSYRTVSYHEQKACRLLSSRHAVQELP